MRLEHILQQVKKAQATNTPAFKLPSWIPDFKFKTPQNIGEEGATTNIAHNLLGQLNPVTSLLAKAKPRMKTVDEFYTKQTPEERRRLDSGAYKAWQTIKDKPYVRVSEGPALAANMPPEILSPEVQKPLNELDPETAVNKYKALTNKTQASSSTNAPAPAMIAKQGAAGDTVQRLLATLPLIGLSSMGNVQTGMANRKYERDWQDAPRSAFFKPRAPSGTNVISNQGDVDSFMKKLAPTNPIESETVRRQLQHALSNTGLNAYSGAYQGVKGPELATIISKDAPDAIYKHEYAHIKDLAAKIKAGKSTRATSWIANRLLTPFVGATRSPQYKEEAAAWNNSGVPENDPLRQSALSTYAAPLKGWERSVRYGIPGYAAIRMAQGLGNGGDKQGVMDLALEKILAQVKNLKNMKISPSVLKI